MFFPCFLQKRWVLKRGLLVCIEGPGGFRELREASRNYFHLSWYLSESMVPNYGYRRSWEEIILSSTVDAHCTLYYCMDIVFSELFKKFGGVVLEVKETA